MKRFFIPAAMVAIVFIAVAVWLTGCGTTATSNQSNTVQSSSMEPSDSPVKISIARYRLGRGSWDVNASTETGASSGSLGSQKVLVCDLLLTNNSDTKTVISPVDLLCAVQDGETLQFGALYDDKGGYRNPESVDVEPGQTASGIAIWNIDDLQTPVKIKFKCGNEVPLTIMPSKLKEDGAE